MARTLNAQRGSVLPVCLILLLMISLLAMDSLGSATLQMKLVGSRLEHDQRLRQAEGLLSASETWLATQSLTGLQQPAALSLGQDPAHQAHIRPLASLHADQQLAGMLMGIDSRLLGEARQVHLQSTWLAITGETPENTSPWSICLWPGQSVCHPLEQQPRPGRQSWRETDGEQ